ncbi:homeobox protein unc-62-like isoform X2 [Sycon ciliatum]|uniref:homeobox protein unc-62-like isoform X2 n=1 Tax=Sycon ciliatum TaxID=27933 RepID=UPI0031F6A581
MNAGTTLRYAPNVNHPPMAFSNLPAYDQFARGNDPKFSDIYDDRNTYVPASYQLSGLTSAPSSPEQYPNSTLIPVQRIDMQQVQVPGAVNVPVQKTGGYVTGGPQSVTSSSPESAAVSGGFAKRAGSYVLVQAPTWTAIPTAVHTASASQSVPLLVQPSTTVTTGCDSVHASQPPTVITPDPNAMNGHHHHTSQHQQHNPVALSAASCGGFSFPQVTPMSSPESQAMPDTSDNSGMSPAAVEEQRRLHMIRQSLKNEIVRSTIRVREPRPRQEKCACPDNSCVAGRDRPITSTRNHYSCKTATKLLMTWVEEHQENPYPDREEKKRLAKQSCMTVKQLADWFGNARRRKRRQQQDEVHMANRERELRLAID